MKIKSITLEMCKQFDSDIIKVFLQNLKEKMLRAKCRAGGRRFCLLPTRRGGVDGVCRHGSWNSGLSIRGPDVRLPSLIYRAYGFVVCLKLTAMVSAP